ncbi:hypothetical protein BDV23DRAFT_166456 [Aspergillus alliaceus]|uniref:Uncharacterized protein n=1 Tax=Petromyces alliaceus TaxID=209559 RepID=A0A5N7BS72_PETAA|nr:hypothetical protein BDV23DRAFT_166456 [Aspergillus alliaceus]
MRVFRIPSILKGVFLSIHCLLCCVFVLYGEPILTTKNLMYSGTFLMSHHIA